MMIVYRLDILTGHEGCLVSWHPSYKMAREHVDDYEGIWTIEKVNIPTDKPGLLRWLNIWYETDNG